MTTKKSADVHPGAVPAGGDGHAGKRGGKAGGAKPSTAQLKHDEVRGRPKSGKPKG
ncbi:hypothetical protein ACLBKU_03295 [Erythrobacter sp. NE805]|uniref:hypothetical protein n=1 Tax=Erythrobacter sp. NE805 TaxID=3389875 RepID=UPI00396B0385